MFIHTIEKLVTQFETAIQGRTIRFSLDATSVTLYVSEVAFEATIGETLVTGQAVPMVFNIAGPITPEVITMTPILMQALAAHAAHQVRMTIAVRDLTLLVEYDDQQFSIALYDVTSAEAILRQQDALAKHLLARRQDANLLRALARLPWSEVSENRLQLSKTEASEILAEVAKKTVVSEGTTRIHLGSAGWIREEETASGIDTVVDPILQVVASR